MEIIKDQTAAVTMTNTYARDMGTFSVTKAITGLESVDNEFTFSYTCDNNVRGTVKVKADGLVVSGPELPVGTTCTIEEDAQSAVVQGYTLEVPAAQTVTMREKEQAVLVTFTNTYTPEPTPSASPTPSETATPEPSESPSPTPSASPSESASPSPSASESPSPSETLDPSESPSQDPTPSTSASPNPSDPATPGDPSSPSQPPQVGPSDPPVPGSASGVPSVPSGGPLASTGVKVGLPLAFAILVVMGGALLVSRRRA